jgi:hypothetical protein
MVLAHATILVNLFKKKRGPMTTQKLTSMHFIGCLQISDTLVLWRGPGNHAALSVPSISIISMANEYFHQKRETSIKSSISCT